MKDGAIKQKTSRFTTQLDPGNLLMLVYITVMVCFLLLGSFIDGNAAIREEIPGVDPKEVAGFQVLGIDLIVLEGETRGTLSGMEKLPGI